MEGRAPKVLYTLISNGRIRGDMGEVINISNKKWRKMKKGW